MTTVPHNELAIVFDYDGKPSKTISLRRINVRIQTPGGSDKGSASIVILGMSLSDMNALSILPTQVGSVGRNTVTVLAGTGGPPTSVAFIGTIQSAFVQGSMPDIAFVVSALGGSLQEHKPVPPFSSAKPVDVAQTMGQLAQQAGFTFENNGVSKTLSSRYLWGSAMQQIRHLAQEAGIEHVVERNKLAIWNPGESRSGDAIEINENTGMVSLPSFSSAGVRVTTKYRGTINYGAKIHVTSILTAACGTWVVYSMEHELDTETPSGAWFTVLDAHRLGTQSASQ